MNNGNIVTFYSNDFNMHFNNYYVAILALLWTSMSTCVCRPITYDNIFATPPQKILV